MATMATKDQERKALEKIRKIVADLGDNSYIGTAFEGCFEIAQENIDNDFACSMKQRVDTAAKIIKELEGDIDDLNCKYNALQAEFEKLQFELHNKVIDEDDLKEAISIASKETERMEEAVRQEAENIVIFADRPDSESFMTAVTNHRLAMKNADRYDNLVNSLEAALANY